MMIEKPRLALLFLIGIVLFALPLRAHQKSETAPAPAAGEPQKSDQTTKTVKAEDVSFELPLITPGPSMTLAEVLAAADKNNVTVAAARMEIEKAAAQLKQAWALVLPGAQGSLQYLHNDHKDVLSFMGTEPMVVREQEDLKGIIQIGMPLINLKNWYTIDTAKAGIEVAEKSVEAGRRQLLLGTAQAYHFALMARSLIALYESQVDSASHHLKVAKARFNAGTGLRVDVIRAETDLEQVRQDLLAAHLSFDNARDAIRMLIRADELPMPIEAPSFKVPAGDEKDLAAKAVSSRPDIEAKDAMIRVMEKQLDASWMQFLPTLDVGWQLQYQFTQPGQLTGTDDRSRWGLMFTLSVPIYNQFRYGDLDYKRASLRQAMLQAEDARLQASNEVRKARRDYLSALTLVDTAERQSSLAKEALTLVEASYNAGTGSSLDVTDARRTVAATNVNVAAKRLQAQIALLTLLSAIGEDVLHLAQ